jgi:hypothetical protein
LHFVHAPKTLWKTKFKGNRLINLVEEISSQASIQAYGMAIAGCFFSQIYIENWEEKSEWTDLIKIAVFPEKELV